MTVELANEVIEMLMEKISSKKMKIDWNHVLYDDRVVVSPFICGGHYSLFARMPGTTAYDWIGIVRTCKTTKEYEHMKRCKTYAKWFIEEILKKSMEGNNVFICARDNDILFLKRKTSLEQLLIEHDMWSAARKNAEKEKKRRRRRRSEDEKKSMNWLQTTN